MRTRGKIRLCIYTARHAQMQMRPVLFMDRPSLSPSGSSAFYTDTSKWGKLVNTVVGRSCMLGICWAGQLTAQCRGNGGSTRSL